MKRKRKQKKSDGTKEVKNLLIGLSVLFLIALFYRMGIDRMTAEMEAWKTRAIEAEKIVETVEKIEEDIKKYQPRMKQEIRFTTAVMIYTGSKVTKVPVNYQKANIKVETEFNPFCRGSIYGERGLHQILGTSFRKYYSAKYWGNQYAEYWAGMYHLQECYNLAMAITEEDVKQNLHYIPVKLRDKPLKEIQLALMLSLHNSGTGWRNIFKSFTVTQPHIARSLQQNVYEYLEEEVDRGLSV
jgi:hypothetical protein